MTLTRPFKLLAVPLHQLTAPRDGDVMTNRWWIIRGDCALLYQGSGHRGWSPQCNSNRVIAESLKDNLCLGATTVLVPAAYLGPWDEEYGHQMSWVDKTWVTEQTFDE